jgi:hypothetical protein
MIAITEADASALAAVLGFSLATSNTNKTDEGV